MPRAKRSAPTLPSLPRERLTTLLEEVWSCRLGVVVGPAGSGKTTLLSQFAVSAGVPAAWYRTDAGDGSVAGLLAGLDATLSGALGLPPTGADSVEGLAVGLEAWSGDHALLVVDDAHALSGTNAEAALEALIEYAPPSLRVLIASRCPPAFNLPRLRVSGAVVEIGSDDLRFRSWEVESLFRDFYAAPMRPEDVAELARRTEGWAAGLQLFHLATRGKSSAQRRRILTGLAAPSRVVGEYLARNVLDDLPSALRAFLLDTCVLTRLSGTLCDALLEGTGSEAALRTLEHLQIFTVPTGDGASYRYHEVLRAHLEGMLLERLGEEEVRRRHQGAGRVLEEAGHLTGALRSYSRAEDWRAVVRLLGRNGKRLAADSGAWLDSLSPVLFEHDAWLNLARARRFVALGRLEAAADAYRRAELAFDFRPSIDSCRTEQQRLQVWLDGAAVPATDWMSTVRAATQHDPLAAGRHAASLPGVEGRLAEGLCYLLAGRFGDARRLVAVAEDRQAGPVLSAVADVFGRCAAFAATGQRPHEGPAGEEFEELDLPWFAELRRRVRRLAWGEADLHATTGEPVGADAWGEAIVLLVDATARLCRHLPAAQQFEQAGVVCRGVRAEVLETWARAGQALALAIAGDPDARSAALAAHACARSCAVPGAEAVAHLALGLAGGPDADEHLSLAETLARDLGLEWSPVALVSGLVGNGEVDPPAVFTELTLPARNGQCARHPGRLQAGADIRCFGGFGIQIGGETLDCRTVKPRPRSALHLFALHAQQALHRETLVDALWPDATAEEGQRKLHVVVSCLRRFLRGPDDENGVSWIVREGDAYRLALPAGSSVDVQLFEEQAAALRTAHAAGDYELVVAAGEKALSLYTGELLPEDGPADWAVHFRDRYRAEVVAVSRTLAEVYLDAGRPSPAVAACERGLRVDRYRDSLWRLLIRAWGDLGDKAAARRAQSAYETVLDELGVASGS